VEPEFTIAGRRTSSCHKNEIVILVRNHWRGDVDAACLHQFRSGERLLQPKPIAGLTFEGPAGSTLSVHSITLFETI
jgi:hypothetical protein